MHKGGDVSLRMRCRGLQQATYDVPAGNDCDRDAATFDTDELSHLGAGKPLDCGAERVVR